MHILSADIAKEHIVLFGEPKVDNDKDMDGYYWL